jgi:hypothetical protein
MFSMEWQATPPPLGTPLNYNFMYNCPVKEILYTPHEPRQKAAAEERLNTAAGITAIDETANEPKYNCGVCKWHGGDCNSAVLAIEIEEAETEEWHM